MIFSIGLQSSVTRAVEQALTYIADHQDEVVSVQDIYSENDIALRTLNRAFNERFGIGPKSTPCRLRKEITVLDRCGRLEYGSALVRQHVTQIRRGLTYRIMNQLAVHVGAGHRQSSHCASRS